MTTEGPPARRTPNQTQHTQRTVGESTDEEPDCSALGPAMDFVHPVRAVIPGAGLRVLAVLATTAELNLTTLAPLAGVGVAQASRVMPGLVELGLVEGREIPPSSQFRLIRHNVAARAILALADARSNALHQIGEAASSITRSAALDLPTIYVSSGEEDRAVTEESFRVVARTSVVRVAAALTGVGLALLAVMVVVERIGPRAILEPSSWQNHATMWTALLSVSLLVSDVVLPVPSSVVLVINGAVFGGLVGSAVSFVGLVSGALVGYWLGRRGTAVARRVLGGDGAAWLASWTTQHGIWIVGSTRAIPLASEIAALTSGAVRMRPGHFVLAVVVGSLATATPMAFLGAGALDSGSTVIVLTAAIGTGALLWAVGRQLVSDPRGVGGVEAGAHTAVDGVPHGL